MFIERILSSENRSKYQIWKRRVKQIFAIRKNLWLKSFSNGGLRRLSDTKFRPIFICGVSGSGTTLISGLLDQQYENEFCLHESDRMKEAHPDLFIKHSSLYENLDAYYRDLIRTDTYSTERIREAKLNLYRQLSSYPRYSDVILDKAPNSHLVRIGHLYPAFPMAKIVLIHRDPVETIEGLIRKWPQLFGRADTITLCEFWNNLHLRFIKQASLTKNEVFAISYEKLVQDPNTWLERLASWADLKKRDTPKVYVDKTNKPGKGLRNILGGEIKVVSQKKNNSSKVLPTPQVELIRENTRVVLARLVEIEQTN
ncbi:MAG: sulfotransferase [Anaerolineales bacterium]|nr:sulfotransferase [Anaerolineales bacterium]